MPNDNKRKVDEEPAEHIVDDFQSINVDIFGFGVDSVHWTQKEEKFLLLDHDQYGACQPALAKSSKRSSYAANAEVESIEKIKEDEAPPVWSYYNDGYNTLIVFGFLNTIKMASCINGYLQIKDRNWFE
ncbi:hypothetical protein MP228_000049 [Amoeboaphelidium protococcarum]|nr:hypothetical protein MP228_000049 [Amoeboaphelidium protococcarum]